MPTILFTTLKNLASTTLLHPVVIFGCTVDCSYLHFTSLVFRCPRFTLHQYRTQSQDRIRQGQKNGSPNAQPQCDILMYPSRSPHLVRPHSSAPRVTPHASTPREISNSSARHVTSTREFPHPQRESLVSRSSRETLHASSSREISHASSPRETLRSEGPREKRAKPHPRSKSAQGRIVTTPYHTNAGKKQLEVSNHTRHDLI